MLATTKFRYRRFNRYWFLPLIEVLVSCVLPGCGSAPTRLGSNDFENIVGWQPVPVWLTNENAHSGNYAIKMHPGLSFGPSYSIACADLGSARRLRVSAWVNLPHSRMKGGMVVSVERDGQSLYWRSLMLNQVVRRYHRWQPVTQLFELPPNLLPTDVVKVYCWHTGELSQWYADDFVIEKLT